MKLIGPFTQLLTMRGLNLRGSLQDDQLEVLTNAAILVAEKNIIEVGNFDDLRKKYPSANVEYIAQKTVALPGFIDVHTHICFAGDRANDYAMRSSGKTYLEIAQKGGGIWSSVQKTREASLDELASLTKSRAVRHIKDGVTTIEVKSGYGLNVAQELKMLRAIKLANKNSKADLIATCLAAHMKPRDFEGLAIDYLENIVKNLLPILREENLTNRADIFVEKTAFTIDEARYYLAELQKLNFDITVHADQFSAGASALAVEFDAVSADHLEVSGEAEIAAIAKSNTVAVALPGSSYGLGIYHMTPARKLLDASAIVAIASDWNPGSAPMGDLLAQAAMFGIYEKLSAAEIFAALTFRAAKALKLSDRGIIEKNMLADFQLYPLDNYQQILYNQGKIKPFAVYKNGEKI
jgi:imidazolonepropionase